MRRFIVISMLILVAARVAFALAAPDAIVLTSPANAATGQVTNVTLTWEASVALPDSYAVKIGTAGDATDTFYGQTSATVTKTLLLRAGETYYWRVKARNAEGWGDYSETWSFRTAPWPESKARRRRH